MTQNPADITLTPAETLLASRIQFDPQVLCAVKSMVGRDVEPYYQFMYKGQKIVIEADVKMLEFVIKADGKAHWKGFTVKIESDYTRTWPAGLWVFLTACARFCLRVIKHFSRVPTTARI